MVTLRERAVYAPFPVVPTLQLQAAARIEYERRKSQRTRSQLAAAALPRIQLHPGQIKLYEQRRRYNAVACGRRWGKSTFAEWLSMDCVLAGQRVGYFAPDYKTLEQTWQTLTDRMMPLKRSIDNTAYRFTTWGGGVVEGWTLKNIDAGRGRKYHRIIIDEAGLVPKLQMIYEQSIRATLMDYHGDAWFLGTPKGRRYFYDMFQRGLDPLRADNAAFTAPSFDNPYIDNSEIEEMLADMTERNGLQEVYAQFLDDGGGVFRNVRGLSVLAPGEPVKGHHYVAGIDWGRVDDYTVVSVWDRDTREEVLLDRYNGLPYTLQRERIYALLDRWGIRDKVDVWAESNSIGEPIIEQMGKEHHPVTGFETTNASKAVVVDRMALALEREVCSLQADLVGVGEMEAFECTLLPGGSYRYAAPEGQHDDIVIARCLGWAIVDTGIDWASFLAKTFPAKEEDPALAEEQRRQRKFEESVREDQRRSEALERRIEQERKGKRW